MSEPTTEHTYEIDPALVARWSPRAFSTTAELNQDLLGPAFEAARWSASDGNGQPWSFVVGFRGDDVFTMLTDSMNPGNSVWAVNGSAVVASIARTHNSEGEAISHALYDLGQAVAHFSVQATSNGLVVHQMSGFDATALHGSLGLDDHHAVVTLFVVGTLGDPAELSERLREREVKPRVRKPLSDFVSGSVSYP